MDKTDEELFAIARAHMEKYSAAASLDRRLWDATVRLVLKQARPEAGVASSLAAKLNELDASRYRYMRNNATFQDRYGPGLYWYLPRWNRDLPIGERLDQAIDEQIKSSQPQRSE